MSLNRLATLALLLMLVACGSKQPKKERPPVPVRVGTAYSKTMPYVVRGVGNMVAWNKVDVTPQVSGEITAVYFEDGEFVKQGDLLMTIDPSYYQAQLEQALGELKQAEASLAYNQQRVERYQGLLPEDFVSELTFADYLSQAVLAEGQLQQFRGAVQAARVDLDYCWIRAGLTGKTDRRRKDPGNVVFPAEGEVLVTINQIKPINVNWSVPERFLPDLLKYQTPEGLTIQCEVLGEEGRIHTGLLSYIGNQVDTQTGTISLQGDLDNEDYSLWPGQYARITIILYEIPDAVVIPSAALQVNTKGRFVFVLKEDNTVEMRQVKTGQLFGAEVVIEEGLKDGKVVITEGQVLLGPGTKVRVKGDGK